jgi:DNA repair protein SbcD/Mre11
MKILHTSDIHLGKRLHDIDMMIDQSLFLNWLLDLVRSEKADALLISGDIFDVANPSSEARKLYYEFLVRISSLHCRVIITGGNHDSPMVLEAPRELLKALNIHVVGAWPENPEDAVIELRNQEDKLHAVVAAVPFLRNRDLRKMIQDESNNERLDAIREGILRTYTGIAEYCRKNYTDVPAIAMGHLYMRDTVISDSEREIQVGNLAGVEAGKFPDHFNYYALGHLHTPQEDETGRIVYSGSPYPLSFSEKDNQQRVMMLTINGSEIGIASKEVPIYRKLLKYKGSLEEVANDLRAFTSNVSQLETLIELEVVEEDYNPETILGLELLQDKFDAENARIVKSRVNFLNKAQGTDELYAVDQDIEDLEPRDVFDKLVGGEQQDKKSRDLLFDAFDEILQMVNEEE